MSPDNSVDLTDRSRAGHTPGPWFLVVGKERLHVQDGFGHDIADFPPSSETTTALDRVTQIHNALLCAGAPQMRDALERVVADLAEFGFTDSPIYRTCSEALNNAQVLPRGLAGR